MSSKTYVSSTVYNLAGDPDLRPEFLRTIILGSVLAKDRKSSIGASILQAAMSGPGMRQRKFFRWSRDNYALGMPTASIDAMRSADPEAALSGITSVLAPPAGSFVRVVSAQIDTSDVDYWARVWILRNHPTLPEDSWSAEWRPDLLRIVVKVTIGAAVTETVLEPSTDFLWGIGTAAPRRLLLYIIYEMNVQDSGTGLIQTQPAELFTYRMGSGNVVFDALLTGSVTRNQFFPALPLRLNNKSIRHESLEDTYAAVKKAYKKLSGNDVNDLLDQIEENTSIGDIDFCFLVSGVSANAPDNQARRYMYEFFKNLIPDQLYSESSLKNYMQNTLLEQKKLGLLWDRWLTNNSESAGSFLAGDPAPSGNPVGITKPAYSELRINSALVPAFDHRLRWIYIKESLGVGNGKTFDGALTRGKMKVGDFWFNEDKALQIAGMPGSSSFFSDIVRANYRGISEIPKVSLFHQTAQFAYRRLEIVGMEHINMVYNDKAVTISLKDAIKLKDEESGFLVPLQYQSIKDMGLIRSTQLSSSSTYLVFNSYKVVKRKWYQRGIFKLLLVLVSVVISVVFPPAGLGLSAGGLLGSNLAIGATLGLGTGVAAAIAGAVANAIASMVLTTLVQMGAKAIFGDKLGAILGTILSMVSMTYANAYAQTGSFSVDWGKMFRAENLMKLTNAVSGAYSAWVQADTLGIYEDIAGLGDKYADKFDQIKEMSREMLGMTSAVIDPMMFTDPSGYTWETSDEFISRTMLTGEEIAELSQSMIYDFAEISLELPKTRA